ncbi:EAL domain-containing protein [Nitrosomonas sp.]|uniref:EAL domain-containing protein n=1 Tax=Nitrosomonas sp. TaxID=42353 RepID=UPI0025F1535D|nr:EAL domain-containing protein [Nitrosomonas sp.]MBY0484241.1 EAL domain-containing protein [Nitrosomonas sp.]
MERFHLASLLDLLVLRSVIQWLSERSEDAPAIDMLCINLSGQSIGDRIFHSHATNMLRKAGSTICAKICLEITETAAVMNLADTSSFIEQVSRPGVRVALDDFGAGASSFGYSKNLAVDILKIDGQFIKDLIYQVFSRHPIAPMAFSKPISIYDFYFEKILPVYSNPEISLKERQ